MTAAGEALDRFATKMEKAGIGPVVIETFAHYYRQIRDGATGLIYDREIEPVQESELRALSELDALTEAGRRTRTRAVKITLNGGLGTSMGLTGPKALIPVRNGRTFLDIILAQTQRQGVRLALMNSFNTHEATLEALSAVDADPPPLNFVQHQFPKILREGLLPASWPPDATKEWNPPGHGDVYTALYTSGMLKRLLDEGIRFALIANSDNLGATVEPALLGYFATKGFPFMMEVAAKTPADVKGGHLARHRNGRLILREAAQCPPEEQDAFRDIRRYRFFNTNNIWINLEYLGSFIEAQGFYRLPLILNPKNLDPRDASSPAVYQVETAMGAAISLFEGATAVRVPRSRFYPVKKCNDLLAVQSDYFLFDEEDNLVPNPDRRSDQLRIDLDGSYFGKYDMFTARFPQGAPSLIECESLTVRGDVRFEAGARMRGNVVVSNQGPNQAVVAAGQVLEGDILY